MPTKFLECTNQSGCNGTVIDKSLNSVNNVVISGISGRLPESNSIAEFKENLFSGVDMVTDDDRRWPAGEYKLKLYN